jgi:hypothetical protein
MASTHGVEQVAHDPSLTSSETGTFYFAFGSNLSPFQMSRRLRHCYSSSVPVAIARLDSHAWIICQRGYANVVALPPSATPPKDETTVWGVLYNLDPVDESRLDLYEGHNQARNPEPVRNEDPKTQVMKPYEQGNWDYNKHYLPVTVTKWLKDPSEYGINAGGGGVNSEVETGAVGMANTVVRALVYVDELRTKPGKINDEYIGRMNRAIKDSVNLGIPHAWVENVMRKFVPKDIWVDDEGYVGTDEGHVEAAATEADDEVTENMLKNKIQEENQ